MSQDQDSADFVIHRHVALMICEDAPTLEELLQSVDTTSFTFQRVGARAIMAPAPELALLRRALEAQGVYPKITGQPVEAPEELDD